MTNEELQNIKRLRQERLKLQEEKTSIYESFNPTIDELYSQLRALEKEKTERLKAVDEKVDTIHNELRGILHEPSRYGTFDIESLGMALAYLTSKITGIQSTFDIVEDEQLHSGFYCRSFKFKSDVALIKAEDSSFSFCFREAPEPPEEIQHKYEMAKPNKRKEWTSVQHFDSSLRMAYYCECAEDFRLNVSENHIEYNGMRNITLPPFVKEFIIFVANYRLENDMPDITLEDLMNLVPIFIEKYYKGKPFTMKKQGERK